MKNKTFIIAEIGNSHNGNFKYALRAINSAKKAGADAVKFQFIKPAELVHPNLKPYNPNSKYKTQLEKFSKVTLKLEDFRKLSKYAKLNSVYLYLIYLQLRKLKTL